MNCPRDAVTSGGVAETFRGGSDMCNVPSPVVSDNPQAVSGPQTVYLDRQDVPEVFRRAFPGYRGASSASSRPNR